MKPVAIFQYAAEDGPAYFLTYLAERSIPHREIRLDLGAPVPLDPCAFSGLAFMGGPMSANDPLDWIAPLLGLIRAADRADVPMIGHCLGGQLLSKALGGVVLKNPVKEIGWGTVHVGASQVAREWFGADRAFESFHWHGETFSIPPGGIRLASSAYCANQAFVIGRHLAMQCHVEMTEAAVRAWGTSGREEIRAAHGPAVQSPATMALRLEQRIEKLHRIADRLYDRWTRALATG